MFAANLHLVLNVLFFVQGLSLAFWWIRRRRLGPFLQFLAVFVMMIPLVWLWLVFLGVSDMVFNFRSRVRRPDA